MWSVGGALAHLAGQSCLTKHQPWCLSKNIQSRRQKKRRSPGTAVCRFKKKTEPQTGRSASKKKNEAANQPFSAPQKKRRK
jgi:hypothetical protein